MQFLKSLFDSRERGAEMHLFLGLVAAVAVIALTAYSVVILREVHALDSLGQNLGFPLAGTGAAAWGQGALSKATQQQDPT